MMLLLLYVSKKVCVLYMYLYTRTVLKFSKLQDRMIMLAETGSKLRLRLLRPREQNQYE